MSTRPLLPPREHLALEASLRETAIAVIDLSDVGAALLERRSTAAWAADLWVDLHDYDGAFPYHEPFVTAADVVFMNDDRTSDPWALMGTCLERGPRLAVCTRGAAGAIALDARGARYSTRAVPADIVDTNGAGDAFIAGFLHATLSSKGIDESLRQGAVQAAVALETVHLHPSLSAVLGDVEVRHQSI